MFIDSFTLLFLLNSIRVNDSTLAFIKDIMQSITHSLQTTLATINNILGNPNFQLILIGILLQFLILLDFKNKTDLNANTNIESDCQSD